MKANTKKIYELMIDANDEFIAHHQNIHTSVGLMDQALRNKGIQAEAVTIDNVLTKVRVILIILDNNEDNIGIGVGHTEQENVDFLSEVPVNQLTVSDIISVLTLHLV